MARKIQSYYVRNFVGLVISTIVKDIRKLHLE